MCLYVIRKNKEQLRLKLVRDVARYMSREERIKNLYFPFLNKEYGKC